MMRHIKVEWNHNFSNEPSIYYHEIGEDNWEVRRVQVYKDGRREWADEDHETSTAGLAEIPISSITDINSQSEFDAREISSNEFETEWTRARNSS